MPVGASGSAGVGGAGASVTSGVAGVGGVVSSTGGSVAGGIVDVSSAGQNPYCGGGPSVLACINTIHVM